MSSKAAPKSTVGDGGQSVEGDGYHQAVEKWRQERDDSYRSPDGWLSLAGLFMLENSEYTIGSGDDLQIVLPASAPAQLGRLNFKDGAATLEVTSSTPVLVNGIATTRVDLVDNQGGRAPTIVKIGTVSMNLHRFGANYALRVRDITMPAIEEFGGCKWYEIKPEYRVRGRLTRPSTAEALEVLTSVKTTDEYQIVGAVDFELLGRPLTLYASPASKPNELFIIFRDETSGRLTYGAGRYLYVQLDESGEVILDFNKAYSPPCAFTPYATCSLPPAKNRLPVAVEAGELY